MQIFSLNIKYFTTDLTIYSLSPNFVVNNKNHFQMNSETHNINTSVAHRRSCDSTVELRVALVR